MPKDESKKKIKREDLEKRTLNQINKSKNNKTTPLASKKSAKIHNGTHPPKRHQKIRKKMGKNKNR